MNDLIVAQLDIARTALIQAKTIPAVKKILDAASAAKAYAKAQGMSDECIGYAHAVRYEALAKIGKMLKSMKKNRGGGEKGVGRSGKNAVPKENHIVAAATLAELGLDKKTSMVAQQVGELPDDVTEAIKERETTLTQAMRSVKEQKRESRRDKNRTKIREAGAGEQLVSMALDVKFATIVIDPPWDWGDEGDADQLGRARPTYGTMSLQEIATLPVGTLADTDCHLYLWITNRSLPKGFGLLEAWGFRYVTCLTWVKPSFGLGNYFRGSTEQVLFAVRGSQPLRRKDVGTHFLAERGAGGHSSKPDAFYTLIETCSPGPYLEMFARTARPNWTGWGGEL